MPTHAIGADTCNFPVNMSNEERSIWGRFACGSGRSVGAEIRRLALLGLRSESPETAARIDKIRRTRKQIIAGAVCAIALIVSIGQSFADRDGSQFLKASRSVRMRTVGKDGMETEAA